MKCLSESQVLLLWEGRLSSAEQAAIEEHVDGCADCRQLRDLPGERRP